MTSRSIFRIALLVISISGFMNFIIRGDKGISAYLNVKKEVKQQKLEMNHLHVKLDDLKEQIQAWNDDEFLLEQAAREELLLGMPGEKVYIVK